VSLAPATAGRWPFIYVRAAITSSPIRMGVLGPGTARASGNRDPQDARPARRRTGYAQVTPHQFATL